MKSFREYTEAFDRDEFRRHMASLKAKEELKKTNPVAAKAHELVDKEKDRLKSKKSSDSLAVASHNSDPYSSWNSIHSPNWKP